MKNVERLARYVKKNGPEDILIHTIPQTGNWVICQKVENNKWSLSLEQPMGNVKYNLGHVTTKEHLELWKEITTMQIETKVSTINQIKGVIKNFKRNHIKLYNNLLKKHTNKLKKKKSK